MSKPERQLRIIQLICFLFLAAMLCQTYFLPHRGNQASALSQTLVTFAAIWVAISGFSLQRKISGIRSVTAKSTPISRWRTGHILRLAFATSVGTWAYLLYFIGGFPWLVDALFGVALVLLLVWKPGTRPA
ncbi:MAG: hypothetical protein ACLQMO_11280 [Acidobacteriaceae bacterium]